MYTLIKICLMLLKVIKVYECFKGFKGFGGLQARSQTWARGRQSPPIFSLPPSPTKLVYPLEFLFAFIYSVK